MNFFHQQLGIDIEYPVIQAPMAGVQDSALVIAVARAGGLGSLPCAMFAADKVREETEKIRAATNRSFNLNFFCHQSPQVNNEKEASWLKTLLPYYEEFGIDSSSITSGPARLPFNEELTELLEALKPVVVSFHFGLPGSELVARVKQTGAKILSSATTLEEAKWLEANRVDAVIAQGIEAGGHRGLFLNKDLSTQVSTFDLLQQLVSNTRLPIIAAGGIASSREVAKAFELGASGVQVGTSFLRCTEATTTALHRQSLAAGVAAEDTVITNLFTGRPARAIRNRAIEELGAVREDLPDFPNAANAILPLRSSAQKLGKSDFTSMWSGTNTSGCKELPAEQILQELVAGIPN